jgi:hypothetical protein
LTPQNIKDDAMKKLLLAFLLLTPSLTFAEKPKPNPADFTITVHVQSCNLLDKFTVSVQTVQTLDVTINGKKYELAANNVADVLPTGDYKARIASDKPAKTGEYSRTYELLLADGSSRQYGVIGESE